MLSVIGIPYHALPSKDYFERKIYESDELD